MVVDLMRIHAFGAFSGNTELFSNQTRNEFVVDTRELKVGVLLRTNVEAQSVRVLFGFFGYTSNIRINLNTFYVKLVHPQIRLITEDRKYLPIILQRLMLPVIEETLFDDKEADDNFDMELKEIGYDFDETLRMQTPLGNMGFMDHLLNIEEL